MVVGEGRFSMFKSLPNQHSTSFRFEATKYTVEWPVKLCNPRALKNLRNPPKNLMTRLEEPKIKRCQEEEKVHNKCELDVLEIKSGVLKDKDKKVTDRRFLNKYRL